MNKTAIAGIAAVTLLAGAAGAYAYKVRVDREAERSRIVAEVVAAKKAMRDRLTAFDDAMVVAGSTPRISIGAPLLRLSDENRAVQNLVVPPCLTLAHIKSGGATTAGVRVFSKLLELPPDVDTTEYAALYVKGYTSSVNAALLEIDEACAVELAGA